MEPIELGQIVKYVRENICSKFHDKRLAALDSIKLQNLLKRKNPYLFRAKNLLTAEQLVTSFLDATLSSSEEEIFGEFLEDLSLFIANKTLGAAKSASPGIDYEYTHKGIRYLVTVKSGLNWGNSSQWGRLRDDFERANKVLRQSKHTMHVQYVLGVCYGKSKTTTKRGHILQVCGQNFWYMISGDDSLYTEIIEPLGTDAAKFSNDFNKRKAEIINKFTKQFIEEFCDKKGQIKWDIIMKVNSGNITDSDREQLV